jgi:hypothetical protein
MGYPYNPGFRAGIASSFKFFDLSLNRELPIRIHPFCTMDCMYNNHSQQEIIKSINTLKQRCEKYGSEFIAIFHDRNLSKHSVEVNWRSVLNGIFPI